MGDTIQSGFDCGVCGELHVPFHLSGSARAPQAVEAVPVDERGTRVSLTTDQCVLDQRMFFVRGRIVLPLHEHREPWIWGVWAEVSPRDFLALHAAWRTPGREHGAPVAAYLATPLPGYGAATLGLALMLHTRPVGERPRFYLVDRAHPLAVEQREGITLRRAQQLAELLLHGERRK